MSRVSLFIALLMQLLSVVYTSSHGAAPHHDMFTPQVKHQFETAEIVLYGKDVTMINMCNVTTCTTDSNCTMTSNTTSPTSGNMTTCAGQNNCTNSSMSMCRTCSTMAVVCDPSNRRYVTFQWDCVLRDGGWLIEQPLLIGQFRQATASDVTQFNGTTSGDWMYVFIKKVVHSNGTQSYDWSEEFGTSAVFDGEPDDLDEICDLQLCDDDEESEARNCPRCEPGWFRYDELCYTLNMTMVTYSTAMMTCQAWNATIPQLLDDTFDGIMPWLANGTNGYWTANMVNQALVGVGQVSPWNDTAFGGNSTVNAVVVQGGWYPRDRSLTAGTMCVKDAVSYIPFTTPDTGSVQITAKAVSISGSVCCQIVAAMPDMTFGSMTPMMNVSASYMEHKPSVTFTTAAGQKYLIILTEFSGNAEEFGSRFTSWMAMYDNGVVTDTWPYVPVTPVRWQNYMFQIRVYRVGSGVMLNPNGTTNQDECPVGPRERCQFAIHQFEADNQLTTHAIYTWRVWPDVSTVRKLILSRKSLEASRMCVNIFGETGGSLNPNSGLYICNSQTSRSCNMRAPLAGVFVALLAAFVVLQ